MFTYKIHRHHTHQIPYKNIVIYTTFYDKIKIIKKIPNKTDYISFRYVRGDKIVYTQNKYSAAQRAPKGTAEGAAKNSEKRMEKIKTEVDISALIDKYKKSLYNLCFKLTLNRSDADDLFQDTWIKAGKSINNLANHKYLKAWLFRVCINQYKDNYRKEKRRKDVFYDLYDSSETKDYVLENTNYSLSAEEEYHAKADYQKVIAQINLLPNKLKIPMVLFYFEQMKYAEIAQVLSVPEGTVKSRLNAARTKIKKDLNGEI